jgi:hypothetical protein
MPLALGRTLSRTGTQIASRLPFAIVRTGQLGLSGSTSHREATTSRPNTALYDRPMPPADDDIETRLTTVERNVAHISEQLAIISSDAAAARMLAAGADHDVSEVRAELRAHTQALNALRETQLEQGRKIDEQGREMRACFAEQDQRIDEQSRRIDEQSREMREGFATLATGMAQITALLTNHGGSEDSPG